MDLNEEGAALESSSNSNNLARNRNSLQFNQLKHVIKNPNDTVLEYIDRYPYTRSLPDELYTIDTSVRPHKITLFENDTQLADPAINSVWEAVRSIMTHLERQKLEDSQLIHFYVALRNRQAFEQPSPELPHGYGVVYGKIMINILYGNDSL